MKGEEVIVLFLLATIGVPFMLWYNQDAIYMALQFVDGAVLKVLSFLPFVGERFGRMYDAYLGLEPSQVRFQHAWIAGSTAWRPIAVLVILPMCLRWAWQARAKRRQQAFNDMTRVFLDKHLKTPQTVPGESRQQWTVRKWMHFYGLNAVKWGTAAWHRKINAAFKQQLGADITEEESQKLLREFAVFMHGRIEQMVGEGKADKLSPDILVETATRDHHYLSTGMVRILGAACDEYGVLSANGFRNRLFQKPETTPIWFALNGLGRQTTHVESLAILSHFYEEICKGESIKEPQIHNALVGLEKYREHHTENRKLSDLDETEKLADKDRREKSKAKENAAAMDDGSNKYDRNDCAIP